MLGENKNAFLFSPSIHRSVISRNLPGKIYKFFKSLTNGELISKEKQNMPFNLFISAHRRKMIIDAMMKESGTHDQKEGERIMQNYKKQLAERYA